MTSESHGEINTSNNKKRMIKESKTVSIPSTLISSGVQVNSPKTDSHFLTAEDENKNDSDNKIIVKNKKNKNSSFKNSKNKLTLINENQIKNNEEIFLYFNEEINKKYDQDQILYFIFSRLDKDKTLNCNILFRNDSYILYSNSQKFIISAKKEFSFFHENYLIYSTREFSNSSIIAKLHSYLSRTEFILYDKGLNPAKLKNINEQNKNNLRRYLLQIKFLNDKKYEHFMVYLPKNNYFNNNIYNMNSNHRDKLDKDNMNEIDIYENSLPKFDFSSHKYIDTFSDRVQEKSKFNFKIITENKISIECGKVNDINYILDISYPFSPLEAFAIALSVFIKNK